MAREVIRSTIGPVARTAFDQSPNEPTMTWLQHQETLFAQLQEEHARVVDSGEIAPGFLARFPIADGSAVYRVESVHPLTLQHVPFDDGWRISAAEMRGLRLSDLRSQLIWAQLFAIRRVSAPALPAVPSDTLTA